jgi:hypothetical protein
LILEDFQSFLMGCVPDEQTSGMCKSRNEQPEDQCLGCGQLRTFRFLAPSTRQIGVLTFGVRERRMILASPCLTVAWRQTAEQGRDLFFYANVMMQSSEQSFASAHGREDHGQVPPLANLYPTVFSKQRRVFAQHVAGELANGTRFTVTTTLYRRRQNSELEATVCLTADVEVGFTFLSYVMVTYDCV